MKRYLLTTIIAAIIAFGAAHAQRSPSRQTPNERIHIVYIHDCPPPSRFPSQFVDPATGFAFPLPQGNR